MNANSKLFLLLLVAASYSLPKRRLMNFPCVCAILRPAKGALPPAPTVLLQWTSSVTFPLLIRPTHLSVGSLEGPFIWRCQKGFFGDCCFFLVIKRSKIPLLNSFSQKKSQKSPKPSEWQRRHCLAQFLLLATGRHFRAIKWRANPLWAILSHWCRNHRPTINCCCPPVANSCTSNSKTPKMGATHWWADSSNFAHLVVLLLDSCLTNSLARILVKAVRRARCSSRRQVQTVKGTIEFWKLPYDFWL